jgi:hypothetical protein
MAIADFAAFNAESAWNGALSRLLSCGRIFTECAIFAWLTHAFVNIDIAVPSNLDTAICCILGNKGICTQPIGEALGTRARVCVHWHGGINVG